MVDIKRAPKLQEAPSPNRLFDLMTAPGHLIRRAQQVHLAVWNRHAERTVTSVQFAILALLERYPHVDQRTVAEFLSIDTSTLAEVCVRLEERGLVERSKDPDDRRRYVLRLSIHAEELLHDMIPSVDQVGDELLAPLDGSEREQLLASLQKLVLHHQSDADTGALYET